MQHKWPTEEVEKPTPCANIVTKPNKLVQQGEMVAVNSPNFANSLQRRICDILVGEPSVSPMVVSSGVLRPSMRPVSFLGRIKRLVKKHGCRNQSPT